MRTYWLSESGGVKLLWSRDDGGVEVGLATCCGGEWLLFPSNHPFVGVRRVEEVEVVEVLEEEALMVLFQCGGGGR